MSETRPPYARKPPEIVLRLAGLADMPANALGALGPLQRAGWAITPTYCRGYLPATSRTDARLVDSLALRCQRLVYDDGRPRLVRAAGLWLDRAWDCGFIVTPWVRYGWRDWLKAMGEWEP